MKDKRHLYAGGSFSEAGGEDANYIARWDGTSWSTLGSGMNGWVEALAVGGTGHLYAGGRFGTAGGKVSAYFAHWIDPGLVSVEPAVRLPNRLVLHQNYPNPFNPSTTFRIDLPKAGHVHIAVHDMLGRLVTTLLDQHMDVGAYEVTWTGTGEDGLSLPSGLYIYRINSGGYSASKTMMLVK